MDASPVRENSDAATAMLESEPAATTIADASGYHFMLRALRYRDYRLFFFGQGVSLIGTWLTTTATSWLVLQLAKKSRAIEEGTAQGLIRFAAQIPMFLIAPVAGVLVDRWNRHRVLLVVQ